MRLHYLIAWRAKEESRPSCLYRNKGVSTHHVTPKSKEKKRHKGIIHVFNQSIVQLPNRPFSAASLLATTSQRCKPDSSARRDGQMKRLRKCIHICRLKGNKMNRAKKVKVARISG